MQLTRLHILPEEEHKLDPSKFHILKTKNLPAAHQFSNNKNEWVLQTPPLIVPLDAIKINRGRRVVRRLKSIRRRPLRKKKIPKTHFFGQRDARMIHHSDEDNSLTDKPKKVGRRKYVPTLNREAYYRIYKGKNVNRLCYSLSVLGFMLSSCCNLAYFIESQAEDNLRLQVKILCILSQKSNCIRVI